MNLIGECSEQFRSESSKESFFSFVCSPPVFVRLSFNEGNDTLPVEPFSLKKNTVDALLRFSSVSILFQIVNMLKSAILRPISALPTTIRAHTKVNEMANFLDKYDSQQVTLLQEPLILVDLNDQIVGQATKKEAHLLCNIENQPSMVHRAFSFFLFDHSSTPARLILQQRASEKITYPSLWANTCCSHPLYTDVESKGLEGVKHAVQRRVNYELGYDVKLDLVFRAKIFYQARNIPDDGLFGESEVDYIIFAHYRGEQPLDLANDFNVNQNEVKNVQAMNLEQCQDLVERNEATPWFARIVQEGLLARWWSNLEAQESATSDKVIQL
jgi:isopentenyl-diphosphate Delta-isomerase